jgi:hypothetical protein
MFSGGQCMPGLRGQVYAKVRMGCAVVPDAGIEPATFGLQNRCSTI